MGELGLWEMFRDGKVHLRWWGDWLKMNIPWMMGKTRRFIRTLTCGLNVF